MAKKPNVKTGLKDPCQPDGEITPRLLAIVAARNPDYQVKTVTNAVPFRVAAEMIGATAGRIYLRESTHLTAATMSDGLLRELRDAITQALRERRKRSCPSK